MLVPIFACGSMHIGPGAMTLILSVIGAWIVASVLTLTNIWLLISLRGTAGVKLLNAGVMAVYLICAVALFAPDLSAVNQAGIMTLAIGIPLLVMLHFRYLLLLRKRFKAGPAH